MASNIASVAVPGQVVFGEMNAPPVQTYALPALPYAYDALEPHISAEIMTLHHDRHHQAYVTNLNKALANYSVATSSGHIGQQIALQPAIRFNGGGHINHALFWPSLAPAASADASQPEKKAPQLIKALRTAFGDFEGFKATFSSALLSIQGSGWGWLVRSAQGNDKGSPVLRIVQTKDQDPIVDDGVVPILGIDMWEHAYYLQYKNGKQSYVDNIWKIINWTTVEQRYTGKQDDAFEFLKVTLSA